jgi:hypothetical protein
MRRLLALSTLCVGLALSTGCSICASPYDQDYGFYGGSWQRFNASQGRVGSRFNNAGGPVNASEPEVIQTPGTPTPTESPTRPETPAPLKPEVGDETRSTAPRVKARRAGAASDSAANRRTISER